MAERIIDSNYSSLSQRGTSTGIIESPTGGNVNVGGSKYDVLSQQEQFSYAKIPYGDQLKSNLDRANINPTQARYEYMFRTQVLDYYAGRSDGRTYPPFEV